MAAVMNSPRIPKFPTYGTNTASSLAEKDRANIAYLFGNPNFNEVDTLAAERALASGVPGSGFAANNQLRLRDSERINRYQIGHQMLDPYLQREQQVALQSTEANTRLQEIAAQGAQAMEQLRLQQSGQMQLQSAEQQARLQQLALSGQQALEQLRISESGDTGRLNTSIAGNLNLANLNNSSELQRTAMAGAFSLAGQGASGGGGVPGRQADGRIRYGNAPGTAGLYPGALGTNATRDWVAIGNPANIGTSMSGFPAPGAPPVNPSPVGQMAGNYSGGSPGVSPLVASATRTVDQILQRYGLN